MKRKKSTLHHLKTLFDEFSKAEKQKTLYQVVGIEEHNHKKMVVIQLEGHLIQKKTPEQVILDDALVEGLPPKAVRAITYLAVLEKVSPKIQIVSLALDEKLQEYIITLKNHNSSSLEKKLASELVKDNSLIRKLSPLDAHRVGYMAGVSDTDKDKHVK